MYVNGATCPPRLKRVTGWGNAQGDGAWEPALSRIRPVANSSWASFITNQIFNTIKRFLHSSSFLFLFQEINFASAHKIDIRARFCPWLTTTYCG